MADLITTGIIDAETKALVINGKTYDLTTPPDYHDSLVQEQVKSVLVQLNLEEVTENLDLAVELLFVAYNGVAGVKGGALQAEVASIQSDLALLCNSCIETMTTFEVNTKNIIVELAEVYHRLTRNQETLALRKLNHCADSSAEMADSAKVLADKFHELQVRSTKARSNSIEAEATERDRKLAAEKAEADLRAKQAAEKKNQSELVAQISDMELLYNEAKKREEKESDKALAMGIISAIAGAIGAGLNAFASAKNPTSQLGNSQSSGTSAQTAESKKKADEKQKKSDDDQQKLAAAKDDLAAKKAKIEKLKADIEALTKKIGEKQQETSPKEDELQKLKDDKASKQKLLETAQKELSASDKKVQEAQETADKSMAEYKSAAAALQSVAKSTGDMSQAAITAEESIHEEKMKYLDKKLDMEKQKRQSLVALEEYAESIKNYQAEETSAEVSVNSLHAAVEALGKVIATLTNASLFWDQMSLFCKRMNEQGFQQEMQDYMKELTPEERQEEYRTAEFMMLFLRYLCQWIALNGLSGEYVIAAGKAQAKAVEYLKQSPSIEEAMKKAPELAKNMELLLEKSLIASRKISADLEQQKALIAS